MCIELELKREIERELTTNFKSVSTNNANSSVKLRPVTQPFSANFLF